MPGCDRPRRKRDWCSLHYARWRKHGTTDDTWRQDPAERFWRHVDRSAGPDDCWPWTWHTDEKGYGRLGIRTLPHLAHRAAFQLANGRPPVGIVCHSCDNPPCCNPADLYDGTGATNAADRERRGRGRHPRGEQHARAVLTEAKASEILRLRAEGCTYRQIMAATGLPKHLVAQVATRLTWRHVSSPPLQSPSK